MGQQEIHAPQQLVFEFHHAVTQFRATTAEFFKLSLSEVIANYNENPLDHM
jgi:hypothetical protein